MSPDKSSKEALFSIMDLTSLIHSEDDLTKVLHFLVEKIATQMHTDACTLFFYDSVTDELTLKATYGLNTELENNITVKKGEGLAGKTIELLQPIATAQASKDPNYMVVGGLGEEEFCSYLSVPLIYNNNPIGVLAVQNKEKTRFKKKDMDFLLSLATPAVNLVEKAKFVGTVDAITKPTPKSTDTAPDDEPDTTIEYLKDHFLKGIPAVPGIGMGQLNIVKHRFARRAETSDEQDYKVEIELLKEAFEHVAKEIHETKKKAEDKFGPDEASIFEAYLLFLESNSFQQQIIQEINLGLSAVKALDKVVNKYMDRMSNAHDEYIKERAYDIQDVARKISDHLLYGKTETVNTFECSEDTIFSNDFWSISDFVNIDLKKTKGILSANGGASSHISILADSLNLPTVLGLEKSVTQLKDGDYIIIDGFSGTVVVNPSHQTLELYKKEIRELEKQKQLFQARKEQRVILGTGSEKKHQLSVGANLNMIVHATAAIESGADMIGLYRTEFPFLVRTQMPTEEEQYEIYKRVLSLVKGRKVVFRTLDIGGDKYVSYLNLPKESNPSLGWRAIRFSLERKDLFRIQLRALLRASAHGRIKILFPMITSIEQIREVKSVVESVKKELTDEGHEYAKRVPLGAMIEVPSAVEIADKLGKEVDFFSMGTNDLTQYALAVDRTNPLVAQFYDPFHPAILNMVYRTIQQGHKCGIRTTICGDIASQPLFATLLIGFGVDNLSMIPRSIAKIKYLARKINEDSAIKLAKKCLKLSTGAEIKEMVQEYFKENNLTEFTFKGRPHLVQVPENKN